MSSDILWQQSSPVVYANSNQDSYCLIAMFMLSSSLHIDALRWFSWDLAYPAIRVRTDGSSDGIGPMQLLAFGIDIDR